MYNFLEYLKSAPEKFPQFQKGELLLADYYCPGKILVGKLWAEHNFILYVTKGEKQIETKSGIYKLKQGKLVFVRKGAMIMREMDGSEFAMKVFFIPDEFISSTFENYPGLKMSSSASPKIMELNKDSYIDIFMTAINEVFALNDGPENTVLDLKFKELLYILAANHKNKDARSFFSSLVYSNSYLHMQRIMEDNFRFNFSLEEYSRLCNRSLSAFKRDFSKTYGTTPGRWIQERRLQYAKLLINGSTKTVGEIAFSCGFENASHFSKVFRMKFGFPPMTLRRKSVA